jgi:phage terminase large subunit-like protein
MFAFDDNGRLPWTTFIYSTIKKEGKTAIAQAVTTWWAFTQEPPNELKIVANDLDQSVARVFTGIKGLLRHNPQLGVSADVRATTITFSNSTVISAIASDYAGEAGSNHGFTSWTELWGYTSESSRRLWEELTPVPTRRNSIRFIDTYAGFIGESDLLEGLYKAVVAPEEHPEGKGKRIHPTLPIYANREARIVAYWDHEPRMPWQTATYLSGQRASMRPNAYLRLHENRWVSGSEQFVTQDLWDACVDQTHHPYVVAAPSDVWLGIDAGIKHDSSAGVAVRRDGQRVELVSHRIWKPTLHRSITTLRAGGVPIQEYSQTPPNLTAMGQQFFDLLRGRSLRLYPDAELRQQALNTVAIESSRGWRIAKEKSSKKIDAIVALAMAFMAALEVRTRGGYMTQLRGF